MSLCCDAAADLAAAPNPVAPAALAGPRDLAAWVRQVAEPGGGDPRSVAAWGLHLMVEGVTCGGCIRRIEGALTADPSVTLARLNLTTRRLTLRWTAPTEAAAAARAAALVERVERLGYRLVPFAPQQLGSADAAAERDLLRCMAVAGFAAANVMLLSISVWAGHDGSMGEATRGLMHWLSALIALPAVAWAGRPFYRSAWAALRAGGLNMEVPIALAVLLAAGMSLFETIRNGADVYFDSAVTLLFFLLIGRFLDRRGRARARAAAARLVALGATAVTVLDRDGRQKSVPVEQVRPGMIALVAAGDRMAVDGAVAEGRSDIDTSLITGETVPATVVPGSRVFAGTLNLSGPLRLTVTGAGESTLLAEIVRLMEVAEARRAGFVALADRVARWYAPVVHLLGLTAFLIWWLVMAAPWQAALLTAVAVLIITCPCALGLAVPAVQVIASGRLFRRGVLLKSSTALERLAKVDSVVFDKTGTLTLGRLRLVNGAGVDPADLRAAAALAAGSRHPLARAVVQAAGGAIGADGGGVVEERPGRGLRRATAAGEERLGSREFCLDAMSLPPGDAPAAAARAVSVATETARPKISLGAQGDSDFPRFKDREKRFGNAPTSLTEEGEAARQAAAMAPLPHPPATVTLAGEGGGRSSVVTGDDGPELWLARPGRPAVRFVFEDSLRADAADTVAALRRLGLSIELLSGDRAPAVAAVADSLGIERWQAGCTPAGKHARLAALAAAGHRVLMVGDGLNDAPALAAASVSASPSTALDISQTAADAVFQGAALMPVAELVGTARRAETLIRQNLTMAFSYNAVTVPLAMAGLVTPLIAAVAMSLSSLLVTGNALRLGAMRSLEPFPCQRKRPGTKLAWERKEIAIFPASRIAENALADPGRSAARSAAAAVPQRLQEGLS